MMARQVEALGELAGTTNRAEVRRDDNNIVVAHAIFVGKIGDEHRGAQQVVDRDVEEPLQLRRVQVHGQHAVSARRLDEVSDQLGRDGVARFGLAVLAGIAEIGHDGGDAAGAGAAEGVDHDEHFHQVVVDRVAGRLHDKDVGAAHRFVDRDRNLAV